MGGRVDVTDGAREKWSAVGKRVGVGTAAWCTSRVSLSVDVFVCGPDGDWCVLESAVAGHDLAGFESWRRSVWGSQPVQSLGAQFFPQLARGDLRVEPGEVARFASECALLRDHLELITPKPDPLNQDAVSVVIVDGAARMIKPADSLAAFRAAVSARLANIERAAARALEIGGGVVIW